MQSISMRTDLYQLTMAQGYWKLGKDQQRAVFDLYFREHPFNGGYTIVCGLESLAKLAEHFCFTKADIDYLSTLCGNDQKPLFYPDFLQVLLTLQLTINIDAIPEGTAVFPKEPLLRVEGPLWECQLLETVLLNLINFPTLIATKASRICHAAGGDEIVEFGLRRAQGPDGGLTASRAAFVGGASSTSNVLAGQTFGIPVKGTHAHSWVMAFKDEQEAFDAYAEVLPNNCIFLVDTYDSLKGVRHAIQTGLKLKAKGHQFVGIRLDSGDLAKLSIEARKLLDEAGFSEAIIVASNELDEYRIAKLKSEGAAISVWGVGTRLATAYDQPALGGVYKLVALRGEDGQWYYKEKRTDDVRKKTMPGIHQVRRISRQGQFARDIVYDIYTPFHLQVMEEETYEDLLVPIVQNGKWIYNPPSLIDIQKRTISQIKLLPREITTLTPIGHYPVILSLPGASLL